MKWNEVREAGYYYVEGESIEPNPWIGLVEYVEHKGCYPWEIYLPTLCYTKPLDEMGECEFYKVPTLCELKGIGYKG